MNYSFVFLYLNAKTAFLRDWQAKRENKWLAGPKFICKWLEYLENKPLFYYSTLKDEPGKSRESQETSVILSFEGEQHEMSLYVIFRHSNFEMFLLMQPAW